MKYRFIRITVKDELLMVREDQILAIEQGNDKTLVRMAYLPLGMAIETPMSARDILYRLEYDAEELTHPPSVSLPSSPQEKALEETRGGVVSTEGASWAMEG